MKPQAISVLGYALLGLIHEKPSSGYDLRKTFAETAMGSFSNSPGAIYPALERLQQRGLIESEVLEGSGLRRRRVYRLTPSGKNELKVWLSRRVSRDEIVRGLDELMLRFAFMEHGLGAEAAVEFLQSMGAELNAYVPTLRKYLRDNGSTMPLSGMLALDSGVRNYETLQRWVDDAIRAYEEVVAKKEKSSGESKK